MLIFSFDKLNEIFEDVKTGETRVYTEIEEKLYEDYKANEKIKEEQKLELIEDIDSSEKHTEAERAMKPMRLLFSAYILLLNIILSNTEFFCYLMMIVCMIMNGSLLSLVYPISIFIYALLEEKRPGKGYWILILNFTAAVLIAKFLLQTYPFSRWVTAEFVPSGNDTVTPTINSFNDWLMAFRVGIENLDASGRNFVRFFLFESLILLTVTLHILILIFGGVWSQREVEAESIDAAANRISTDKAIKREKAKTLVKNQTSGQDAISSDSFGTDSSFGSDSFLEYKDGISVLPSEYKKLTRKRAFSLNDCTRLCEVSPSIHLSSHHLGCARNQRTPADRP